MSSVHHRTCGELHPKPQSFGMLRWCQSRPPVTAPRAPGVVLVLTSPLTNHKTSSQALWELSQRAASPLLEPEQAQHPPDAHLLLEDLCDGHPGVDQLLPALVADAGHEGRRLADQPQLLQAAPEGSETLHSSSSRQTRPEGPSELLPKPKPGEPASCWAALSSLRHSPEAAAQHHQHPEPQQVPAASSAIPKQANLQLTLAQE